MHFCPARRVLDIYTRTQVALGCWYNATPVLVVPPLPRILLQEAVVQPPHKDIQVGVKGDPAERLDR